MDYPFQPDRSTMLNPNTTPAMLNLDATPAMLNLDATPTVSACKAARDQLQADLLALIRSYEEHYGMTVRQVNLNHSLVMGHPGKTCRVLTQIEL